MAIAVARSKALHRAGAIIPAGVPSVKPYVTGELPLPTFTGTGSAANVNWSDGGAGGSFAPVTTANGVPTTYTPPNKEMVVTVTGTDSSNGANIGTNTLTVQATLPLNPAAGYETDTDQDTETSMSRDKDPRTAVVVTRGPIVDSTPLEWGGRNQVQWAMMRDFWAWHRKGVRWFWFQDWETSQLYRVKFDSALRQRKNGANKFDMSASILGVP